jgi:hypothetical protein
LEEKGWLDGWMDDDEPTVADPVLQGIDFTGWTIEDV